MATTRTDIQFGINHKIYCNELIEGSPLTTKLPFSADTNYKVHCEDFTETDSATCITYDANKDISCNEIIEGDMIDYVIVPAPTLTWSSVQGPTAGTGTLTIKNNSNRPVIAYWSTSETGTYTATSQIAAYGSTSWSRTSNGTIYVYLIEQNSGYYVQSETVSQECSINWYYYTNLKEAVRNFKPKLAGNIGSNVLLVTNYTLLLDTVSSLGGDVRCVIPGLVIKYSRRHKLYSSTNNNKFRTTYGYNYFVGMRPCDLIGVGPGYSDGDENGFGMLGTGVPPSVFSTKFTVKDNGYLLYNNVNFINEFLKNKRAHSPVNQYSARRYKYVWLGIRFKYDVFGIDTTNPLVGTIAHSGWSEQCIAVDINAKYYANTMMNDAGTPNTSFADWPVRRRHPNYFFALTGAQNLVQNGSL